MNKEIYRILMFPVWIVLFILLLIGYVIVKLGFFIFIQIPFLRKEFDEEGK